MSFLDILISLEAMGLGFCVCIGVSIVIVCVLTGIDLGSKFK